MTVVIAMRLNPEYVMGVCDEQQTKGVYGSARTADITLKIYPLGDRHFVGESGSLVFTDEVIKRVSSDIAENMTTEGYAEKMSKAVYAVREEERQRNVGDDYGVKIEDVWKADSPIDKDIVEKIRRELDGINKDLASTFIVAGIDREAMIYNVPFFGKPKIFNPYCVIGSGSDRAEIVLTDYLQSLEPKARDTIHPAAGCRVMMEAVRSAWRNVGVGGRTYVNWCSKEGHGELGSRESNLLQNVIYAESRGALDRDYTDGLFKDVVEQGAKWEQVIKGLRKRIPKKKLSEIFFVEGLHS